jgi:uncharacterized protein (TIGR00299 family) protein
MRIGYLECFSGISGDMLLGALVNAGVPFALLEATVSGLNVGASLERHKVMRAGITAIKVDVITEPEAVDSISESEAKPAPPPHLHAEHSHTHQADAGHTHHANDHRHDHGHARHEDDPSVSVHSEHSHPPHRSLSSIVAIIRAAQLSEAVKERSIRAFELLGAAEAAIHSAPIETIHFHEVGAVDTIVDIVCSAAGCEALNVDRWMASPLNVGSGTVVCQHGTLPVPAPATLALLGDAPVYAAGPPMERVTPTGASLLRMLNVQYGVLPAMRIKTSGYGAGGRDTPGEPNVLRILIGETETVHESEVAHEEQPIAIIETVIDDSSPQLIAYVSDLLLNAGAWDVYRISVQMKKSRTGVQLTVLCSPDLVSPLSNLIFRETTTIGLHWRLERKASLAREFQTVHTSWGDVRIKIARLPSGKVANASPEYEDCRSIAERNAVPLKRVIQEAMQVYAAGAIGKEGL